MSDQTGPAQPGPSQPGPAQPGPNRPSPAQPGLVPAGPGKPSAWRHQARFLGGAFAVAAAVIAVGLMFAPAVTAYSGLSPWVFAGLLGFILVLTGACVLFAASLPTATHSTARATPPVPIPSAAPSAAPSTAPSPVPSPAPSPVPSPAQPAAHPAEHSAAHPPRRGLTILGSVFGVVGLALAALAVVLTVLLPTPTQRIMVQFTDLYGRVQLEYCPALPASFAATASQADLVGSSTILPVKVSGEICGDSEFTDGVWIYLNRASVTVSGQS